MLMKLDTCIATHKGDRQYQQDRCGFFTHPMAPSLYMAVVADGMGGSTGGAEAAAQVVFTAKDLFDRYRPKSDTPSDLLSNILTVSHKMIRAGRFISDTEPHSTAVILLLQDGQAYWAHAGDSRVFYMSNHQFVAMTDDHSVVGELLRHQKITEAQALVHPHRSMLLSCLGSSKEPMYSFSPPTKIAANDKFMLCSDGVWGYFLVNEIEQTIANNDPKPAAQILFRKARERAGGHGDNLSIITIKVSDLVMDDEEQMKDFKAFFS